MATKRPATPEEFEAIVARLRGLSHEDKVNLAARTRPVAEKKNETAAAKNERDRQKAPETDDELHAAIVRETGFDIPRVAVCEDHCAPFDPIADGFFHRRPGILIMKSREAGGTLGASILQYVMCKFLPGHEGVIAGAIEQQAEKALSYVKDCVEERKVNADGSITRRTKDEIDGEPLRKRIGWKNTSFLKIIIATVSGVNSPHPNTAHLDELDLMEDDVIAQAANMSSSSIGTDGKRIPALDLVTSTRKSLHGPMQKLITEIEEAEKLGYEASHKLYAYCIFEASEEVPSCRCAPDAERRARLTELDLDPNSLCQCDAVVKGMYGDDVPRTLQSVCRGRLFRSRGWMSYDDVKRKFRKNSVEVWEAEMECRRPMTDGLYLPGWSRDRYTTVGWQPRPELGKIWLAVDWGGCYDADTEVLTRRGWIKFADASMADEFASLNLETERVEFVRPTSVGTFAYRGEMHRYANKHIDLLVTPEHQMVSRPMKDDSSIPGSWSLTPSRDLTRCRRFVKRSAGLQDAADAPFLLPAVTLLDGTVAPAVEIAAEDWAAFLGLWMAEGHTNRTGNGVVGITHFDTANLDEMESILGAYFKVGRNTKAGDNGDRIRKGFNICDGRLYQHLSPLGKAYEKRLPEYVKTWSPRLLRTYLDWHLRGDGSRNRIYTASRALADDLQEIALYAGWAADIVVRPPRKKPCMKDGRVIHARYPSHVVSLLRQRNAPHIWSRTRKGQPEARSIVEDWSGTVGCVSLERNHTLYVRRNGKAVWSGNSAESAILWFQGPLVVPVNIQGSGRMVTVPLGAYVVFDEWLEADIGAGKLGDKVVAKEIAWRRQIPGFRVTARFADMAGKQQRDDWREHKPPLPTVWYLPNRDFDPTVRTLQDLVGDKRYWIDSRCSRHMDDIESWRQKNGKEVHDAASHSCASARYGMSNTEALERRKEHRSHGSNTLPVVITRPQDASLAAAVHGGGDPFADERAWRERLGESFDQPSRYGRIGGTYGRL